MYALQFQQPAQLHYIQLPIPKPAADEVVIEVAYCGICGTDLHIMAQESPSAAKVVLGHEFSGKVVSKGKNVTNIKIGDHVCIDPNNFCGACKYCQNGQIHFCQNLNPLGVFKNGGWAQYCIAPVAQVHKMPADLPLDWGALTEPISCIIHGWDRLQPIPQTNSILIIGAGLIGLLWGLILRHYGYTNIMISETKEKRRHTARELNFNVMDPEHIIKSVIKKNNGFNTIIDCSGSCSAVEQAVQWLNPLGKFLFFGICPQGSKINIEPFNIFQKELTFLGSVINPFTFPRAIQLISHIQIPLEKLGVRFFALQDYEVALKTASSGEYTKIIFDIAGNS